VTAPTDDGSHPPRAARKVRKLHEPPPIDKRSVSDYFIADLRKSGLDDDTIRAAGLYTEDRPLALSEIIGRAYPRTCGPALVFPFHLPKQVRPFAFRIKPTNPRMGKPNRAGKRKPIKYDQTSDESTLVYLPPWVRESGALNDTTQVLYFTEGEKKSLALDQLRLPCIGLTGVWNYAATGADVPANDAPERLHRTIREHVTVSGRACVIAYDADAKEKPQVMQAAGRLAGVLLAAGAVSVRFVMPPSPEHKGIDDYLGAHGAAATLQLLASASEIEPINPMQPTARIKSIKGMERAPVPEDLRLPMGYSIEKDGVLWRTAQDERHSDAVVARGPILIQRYLDDYYTSEGRVDVAFPRDGRWISVCVERKAICDSRTMIGSLVPFGAPVTSNNATRVIDWFDELEHVNTGKLERTACVGSCGWHTIDGVRTFVAHEPMFADPEEAPPLALDSRGDRRRMFTALQPRGELKEHTAALAAAFASDPISGVMICAALAAPLLEPLGCPNFAVHLPGDSSRGKTTMLKQAASVYGDPNNEHWVANWNTTATAAEMRAAVLCDLPLCFDEISQGDRSQIEKLIYMLVNGSGRTRSQRDLTIRETFAWRTIVLSTGERGLAEESAASGAQVRVVQLPVSGIGQLNSGEIDAIRDACIQHAGSFGKRWLEELLSIEDWTSYRTSLALYRDQLRALAKNSLQNRTAAYWALLCQAESMAAQLGVGLRSGKTVIGLFERLSGSGDQLRPASERARQHVEEWTGIEPRAFPELRTASSGEDEASSRSMPHGIIHGYLRRDGAIVFWPKQLREYLEASGYAYEQVCRDWFTRGWIESGNDGRWQKPVSIHGRTQRMVVLLSLPVVSEAVGA